MQEVEDAIRTLSNSRAGWVARRDAAEALSLAAGRALAGLRAHAQDEDVDVRAAVAKAVRGLELPKPDPAAPGSFSLKGLMAACERSGRREVAPCNEGFCVTVKLPAARVQHVFVLPFKEAEGKEMLRIHTWCGESTAEMFPWLLRNNAKLEHGAFALLEHEGVERVALVENMARAQATPQRVKSTVKEMAHFGDWLENKMSGKDAL